MTVFAATVVSMPFFTSASALFETAQDIPGDLFKSKVEIRAIVKQVTDGDTMKVRHVPGNREEKFTGPLKYHTVIVRIAAVDAPEIAKQGKEGQPYSQESKTFVESKLLNKEVKVKLLSRDQYGRVIGLVKFKEGGIFGFFRKEKDLSEELLKRGLATVYRQGGGQYDGSIKRWESIEEEAIKRRKGMWKNGADKVQLPSDFKKAAKTQRANRI